MIGALCPECQGPIHRSHARSPIERVIRAITRHGLYRCSGCGWRGWINKRSRITNWNRLLLVLFWWAITLAIVIALSLYFIDIR